MLKPRARACASRIKLPIIPDLAMNSRLSGYRVQKRAGFAVP